MTTATLAAQEVKLCRDCGTIPVGPWYTYCHACRTVWRKTARGRVVTAIHKLKYRLKTLDPSRSKRAASGRVRSLRTLAAYENELRRMDERGVGRS